MTTTINFHKDFPDYQIISELGRGNARVLKARHVPTGDLVAIKQFALNTNAEMLRRFQQESDIMTAVDHPNVVKVREMHLDAPMPYLVMEFVEGGDLRGLLKNGDRPTHHLDVLTTLRLGLQMAQAFRAIHPKNIVHRDVKPENILYRRLVSDELHFLLTDFGIAKIRADQSTRTVTGQSLMTYEYAAPEQFDDPRRVSVATDYYALGVVLHECLTGDVPFPLREGAGLASFMNQVLTQSPPTPALPDNGYLPPSLNTLLRRMLDKNGETRLQDPGELELLLEQAKVEWLKASHNHRSAAPARTVTQAWEGTPLVRPVTPAEPAEEIPEEEEPEESGSNNTAYWLLGIALAAVLAFGYFWYRTNQQNSASAPTILPYDSTMTLTDTTSVTETEAEAEPIPIDTAKVVEEQTEPAPATQTPEPPPVESPDTTRPTPVRPDTTSATILPDSTQ